MIRGAGPPPQHRKYLTSGQTGLFTKGKIRLPFCIETNQPLTSACSIKAVVNADSNTTFKQYITQIS